MQKTITKIGFLSNGLLLLAFILSLFSIPNYTLLILFGIIIMMFAYSPLLLVNLNKSKPQVKGCNFSVFLCSFLFIPTLFFSIQRIFFPYKIAIAISLLSGAFLLLYFVREVFFKKIFFFKFSYQYLYLTFSLLLVVNIPIQLQVPDYSFRPEVSSPAYPMGDGPVIYFDEAHNNLHTLKDRFLVTGRLLEDNGYTVKPLREKVKSEKVLTNCQILIICNAIHDNNVNNWSNPTHSAFTKNEVNVISNWVDKGGSLLLIVNHMPISGAAYELAKAFGFELKNGDARQIPKSDNYFIRSNNTLTDNEITNGRNSFEAVDIVLTYDGTGFLIPSDATSILTFDSSFYQWEPDRVWDYHGIDPYPIGGYSQGAYKTFGKGKIVVYGEAMMFTAQLGAGLSWVKLGMNSKKAPQNYRLLLNTIHWLDGELVKH